MNKKVIAPDGSEWESLGVGSDACPDRFIRTRPAPFITIDADNTVCVSAVIDNRGARMVAYCNECRAELIATDRMRSCPNGHQLLRSE